MTMGADSWFTEHFQYAEVHPSRVQIQERCSAHKIVKYLQTPLILRSSSVELKLGNKQKYVNWVNERLGGFFYHLW